MILVIVPLSYPVLLFRQVSAIITEVFSVIVASGYLKCDEEARREAGPG